jgi:hypothetical protein
MTVSDSQLHANLKMYLTNRERKNYVAVLIYDLIKLLTILTLLVKERKRFVSWCYITVDSATAATQNIFGYDKPSLRNKTNTSQNEKNSIF